MAFTFVLLGIVGCGCTKEMRTSRHLSRGSRDFQAQKYDQAEIEYLKALQLTPQHPEALKALGLIYQEEGKFVYAHAFLTKAAQLEPANSEIRLKLALNELALNDLKKAVEDARLVLATQPGQQEALEIIAGSAISTNGLQEIEQQIAKFRQGDKDQASYHVAFGTLALRNQNLTNAETELRRRWN